MNFPRLVIISLSVSFWIITNIREIDSFDSWDKWNWCLLIENYYWWFSEPCAGCWLLATVCHVWQWWLRLNWVILNTAYLVAVKSNLWSTDFTAVITFEGRICWRLRWWLVSLFLPFMLTLFIIFLHLSRVIFLQVVRLWAAVSQDEVLMSQPFMSRLQTSLNRSAGNIFNIQPRAICSNDEVLFSDTYLKNSS